MRIITFTLLLLFSLYTYAQEYDSDKILAEGKLLYRLEKGAWLGTDDFLRSFPGKRDSLGGYLSYETKEGDINTIFYSRNNPDRIFARYNSGNIPQNKIILTDTICEASEIEKDLIAIRNDAFSQMMKNEDEFFKFYENTAPNLIPLITADEKKVYILTGPQKSGVVLIGNDYLLTYDKDNNLINKERIHNSLVDLPATSGDKDKPTVITMHSHVMSEVIDPTDICTLLLYREYVEWNQHIVVGKNYISIFDMGNETLNIMTFDEWEEIHKAETQKK